MTGIGFPSSLNRVQSTLQRDVAAGTVSATDQTALTAALGDIQAQLAAGTASTASTGSAGATASGSAPVSMKQRVDSLIDNEVSAGKLTDGQAGELKAAFQQAHAHMHGAHGHHGGGASEIASIGASTATDGQTTDPTDPTNTNGTTDPLASATNAMGAIEAFINQFKSAVGSNGVYGATGTSAGSTTSLLVNAIG